MSRNGLVVDIETCHENAEIPDYQNPGDAGMDLKAVEKIVDTDYKIWFKTGLKIAIPRGYVGLIFPRSSITDKHLELGNSVGVIDSGYRGEIEVRFNRVKDIDEDVNDYRVGQRVAQLVVIPYPKVSFREVEDLSDSSRGSQGFGSTGDK